MFVEYYELDTAGRSGNSCYVNYAGVIRAIYIKAILDGRIKTDSAYLVDNVKNKYVEVIIADVTDKRYCIKADDYKKLIGDGLLNI